MIAFLPIARYRVDYQIASGRPFSSFERFLLRAVREGHGSVPKLARMFCIHRRLIVEGLVTLMQAGWVSLGAQEAQFVLSPSGEVACDSNSLPTTIAVSDRHLTIIVEKVSGQVGRSNEVDFYTRAKLANLWDGGVLLRKGDISNIVDPGLVSSLIPHQPTEWIRWIGPVNVVSDNAAFAVIDVDTEAQRISGIPKAWESLLITYCLDQVRRREVQIAEAGAPFEDRELRELVRRDLVEPLDEESYEVDSEWGPATLVSSDILWTVPDHEEALKSLIDRAETYLAIASPELSASGIAELLPTLRYALGRGLLVNIFLGQIPKRDNSQAWAALEDLRKLEYDSTRERGDGRLAVAAQETECATNLALGDTKDGPTAILGTYAWTAMHSADNRPCISVRLSDSWAVGRLCELLADFSSADERLRLDGGFVRLKKAAGELRQHAQGCSTRGGGSLEARILLERDHQQAVQFVTATAKESLSVATNDLVAASQSGWLAMAALASERLGAKVQIDYDSPVEPPAEFVDLALLNKYGATFERKRSIDGAIIIGDSDYVLISNYKSDGISARRSYAARIGIVFKGPEARKLFTQSDVS
jgi:hypothetical protein